MGTVLCGLWNSPLSICFWVGNGIRFPLTTVDAITNAARKKHAPEVNNIQTIMAGSSSVPGIPSDATLPQSCASRGKLQEGEGGQ